MNPFPRTFIVSGSATNWRNPPSYPFPALAPTFLTIAVIDEEAISCSNEEAIGAINKAAIGAIIAGTNRPFFVFLFHALLFH